MLQYEYQTMFVAEEEHWWYQGLHDQVRRVVASLAKEAPGPLRILDAGCGTGKVLAGLAGHEAYGLDLSAEALSLSRRRGLSQLARASVTELPCRSGYFDLVVSLDVLPNVEDAAVPRTLAEFRRVLRPGGHLLLNLTAYPFLYSEHDCAIGAYRRYSARSVRTLLDRAGFTPQLLTYSNTLLFLPAAAVRLWKKWRADAKTQPHSDLALPPAPINRLLASIRFFENNLILKRNLRPPFGLSLVALAVKPCTGECDGEVRIGQKETA
jgi:SAM-dependent methyltransferase